VAEHAGYGPPPLDEQTNIDPCWTQLISPFTALTPDELLDEQATGKASSSSNAIRTR
jgi:hypothetical protein